ncbi:MAG: hypothetical protein J7K15_01900, partial [Deltaproteobacteria bacterium]|nr:hypothetical protein [Deltaproteobacteria bacterium]
MKPNCSFFSKNLVAWTWNLSRPSPSGAPLRFAALTDSTYHAEPEGADGERTPTLYLGLKNYYGAKSSPKTVGRFGLT